MQRDPAGVTAHDLDDEGAMVGLPTFGAELTPRPDDRARPLLRGSRFAPIRQRVLENLRPVALAVGHFSAHAGGVVDRGRAAYKVRQFILKTRR